MTATTDIQAAIPGQTLQGTKVEQVARMVMGRGDDEPLTDDDLRFINNLNLEMRATEMTISVGEKRQVRQYEPNDYHASLKIDISGAWDVIFERVRQAEPAEMAAVFTESKKCFYALMSEQHTRHERWLRASIHEQQLADGIKR